MHMHAIRPLENLTRKGILQEWLSLSPGNKQEEGARSEPGMDITLKGLPLVIHYHQVGSTS